MEKLFKLKMTMMPNFISIEIPTGIKQEEAKGVSIPVGSLSEKEAAIYAEEMRQAFLEHWRVSKQKK